MSIEYLAGLIDGEGYIGITRCSTSKLRAKPALAVEMRSRAVVEKLAAYYKIRLGKCKDHNSYRIRIHGETLRKALMDLTPHLIEKKSQAQIVLKLYAYSQLRKKGVNPNLDKVLMDRLFSRCQAHKTLYEVY